MNALINKIKLSGSISWKRIIAVFITLFVFSYLIYRAYHGVRDIINQGIQFSPIYLLISFTCQMVGVALAAFVWSNIIRKLKVNSSLLFDYEAFCASAVARKIPGTIWYAVGRIYLYNFKYQVSKTTIMIGVLIEAIMISLGGLVALAINIMAGFAQISWLNNPLLIIAIIIILVGITSLAGPHVIKYFVKRTGKKQNQQEEVDIPNIRSLDTLKWLLGETIVAFFAAAVGYFVLKSINNDVYVPFTSISGALSLAIAIGPIAMWLPGDIGLKDGFLYLALSSYIGGSQAAVVTLSWRLWVTIMELTLGGLTGFALSRDFNQMKRKNEMLSGASYIDRN
jgi:hypothetical protein